MDINTIFYFPNSLTFEDYTRKLNEGEISSRTIVFADNQKSIYKGGKKYGGLSNQEFHDLVDNLYGDSWISDEINGVKQDILDSSEIIDRSNLIILQIGAELDAAILERESVIQNKVESMMQDAQWILENFPQGVTQWDARWNEDIEAYLQTVGYWTMENGQVVTKWSQIDQRVDSLRSSVNSLTQDGLISTALSSSIQLLIRNNIASLELDTTYAKAETVDGVTRILEWMYSGLKSSASPDKTFNELSSMGKSGLLSAISHIRTQVERLKDGAFMATTDLEAMVGDTMSGLLLQSTDGEGLALLYTKVNKNSDDISSIVLGITGSQATANIRTQIGNALSGYASKATTDSAFSQIYSAIKDSNGNFISVASLKTSVDNTSSTISGLSQTVGQLSTNQAGFLAKTDLDSSVAALFANSNSSTRNAVNGLINTATGSFITSAQADSKIATAKSEILAQVSGGSGTASGSFATEAYVDDNIATAKAEVLASANSNTTSAVAGLAAKTYVDNKVATASATLNASIDNVSASLNLAVKKDSNGKIESTAVLNADQINLQGQTNFENAIGNAITAKSLDIIGGGNATISGDVIAKSLIAGPSDAMHIVTTGNEIHFMSGNTIMGKFVTENNGLQIYVMGPDGNLYKVNFSNWTNTQSSGTSNTYNLYKNKQISGSTNRYEVVLQTSVYGNGDNVYYSDQSGKNLASLGTSSTTGLYMRKISTVSNAILPAASGAASGVSYCMYTIDLYKDTYYDGGTLHDGPNVYGVFKDGVNNSTHYVISSSSTGGVSASSVYINESGQSSCSNVQNLNFGSGNVYLATTSYTPTAFGSGRVTYITPGQNSGTLSYAWLS